MTGNLDPQAGAGNPDPANPVPGPEGQGHPAPATGDPAPVATLNWKDSLTADNKGFISSKDYADSAEGLNGLVQSYANAEKLIGHEKVPIPKGPEDVEGWNRFSKALGIPD